jgi:hypothetical protein
MKNIFDLTKREQRVVIVIVLALVAVAFAKHFWRNKAQPRPPTSFPPPASSPTIHAEEEKLKPDDSR